MKFLYENFLQFYLLALTSIIQLVIVENFFLSSKQLLTNPLATPKIIGALMVLVQNVFNWDYLENHPKNKNKITNYKGNIKLTKHEQDAYKHIQYYLKNHKKILIFDNYLRKL
ncbi:hypothetical protein [Spiroplasma endosymbiont of Lasioglossum malachurum]|uniref:hypothetical protein n=1 Tax=Spiroplasma endosymbiont of Lasioglossum malachurum TaxID=3066319 RepID=UPI0030D5AD37